MHHRSNVLPGDVPPADVLPGDVPLAKDLPGDVQPAEDLVAPLHAEGADDGLRIVLLGRTLVVAPAIDDDVPGGTHHLQGRGGGHSFTAGDIHFHREIRGWDKMVAVVALSSI